MNDEDEAQIVNPPDPEPTTSLERVVLRAFDMAERSEERGITLVDSMFSRLERVATKAIKLEERRIKKGKGGAEG